MSEINRADEFKADMADMKLQTGGASRDAPLQILGVVLMVVGVAVAFGAYRASLNVSREDELDVQSYMILGITGVAITVAGTALYLRCALAKFLRFWLLRQILENRAQLEEITKASGRR